MRLVSVVSVFAVVVDAMVVIFVAPCSSLSL